MAKKKQAKPRLFWVLGGLIFLSVLGATAPASLLKWGLPNSSAFGYTKIEGTVWSGIIRDASYDGADLGDIRFTSAPFALFFGSLKTSVTLNGADIFGKGIATLSAGGNIVLEDTDLRINLTRVSRRYAILGTPIEGAATVKLARLSYSKKGCAAAEGEVWTDFLQGPARLFKGQAFDLAGPVACENGILSVALTGEGKEGSASVVASLKPDYTYTIIADAAPKRFEVNQALRLLGFEKSPAGLTYDASGVFNGV